MFRKKELLKSILIRLVLSFAWLSFYVPFGWFYHGKSSVEQFLSIALLAFGLVLIITPKKIYRKNYWAIGAVCFLSVIILLWVLWSV